SSVRRISSCNPRTMVAESAIVSRFIPLEEHTSIQCAITYDAVFSRTRGRPTLYTGDARFRQKLVVVGANSSFDGLKYMHSADQVFGSVQLARHKGPVDDQLRGLIREARSL